MLNLATALRIYMHTKPIDMCKSFDAQLVIVSTDFRRDVRADRLYLFVNRSRNRTKLLH